MAQSWFVIGTSFVYIGLLFAVATFGDRMRAVTTGQGRPVIYALSLGVYCTSWTFFGSVGLASRTIWEFLPIYIGPAVMIVIFTPFVRRVVSLAKSQNITSVADFIAARYGKNQTVAATVACIAIIGMIPYIALQLKAVSSSLETIVPETASFGAQFFLGDSAAQIALAMAVFAALFGTRHIDATEHQNGLVLAIAAESIVKLIAFLAVGVFVVFGLFDGPHDLLAHATADPAAATVMARDPQTGTLLTMTLLAFFAVLLLPRQFHVTVVENRNLNEVRWAKWIFPAYLVLINLFVIPIALAGLIQFPRLGVDSDMFVLALPLANGAPLLALLAFVGGLSAATAMVIVETVALSIMVSNDLVAPLMLKRRSVREGQVPIAPILLGTRRVSIFIVLLLAYLYYRYAGAAQLASIGLLSFAAIAQLAPAFAGSLFWRGGTARGAIGGMTVGILTWFYTLLLPSLNDAGLPLAQLLLEGPFGIAVLRPQALFWVDLPPLAHGVLWSLALNALVYVALSVMRAPTAIERLQADIFVPPPFAPSGANFRPWRAAVTVGELIATVGQYLGSERAEASFRAFAQSNEAAFDPAAPADFELMRHAEHLLASAIGAASSRLVLSLLLRKRSVSAKAALKLLDDAHTALHYNREILQIALDHVGQGIAVFNHDLHLVCSNRQFGQLLDLPSMLSATGTGLDEILAHAAERAGFNAESARDFVSTTLARIRSGEDAVLQRFEAGPIAVEMRVDWMPDGGIVTSFTDITQSMEAAQALERANESLERRVQQRTEELTQLNAQLVDAKAAAEDANLSKTRFLAAASHDLLQPLNAARLYVTSFVERQQQGGDVQIASNIDQSLQSIEEILGVLLDISRLDAGGIRPDITAFHIADLLRQIAVEFEPLARARGLRLDVVPCSCVVRSDRALLRRLVENLVSNALKYTPEGRVLVGCRRRDGRLRIDIYDTGIGIPPEKRADIFVEFQRLDQGARMARGVGLGLSIVERIARTLGHRIRIHDGMARGSHFSVDLPLTDVAVPLPAIAEPVPRERAPFVGETVLCLDNEATILDGMCTLLGGWGAHVLTAASLTEARAALAAHHAAGGTVTALLVDYHLDQEDGLSAIAALRAQFGKRLPAALITADRSAAVREAARAGGVGLLHKPVKPAALRAILDQSRRQNLAAAE